MFHFYNNFPNSFNISSIFSIGLIISSTFHGFSSGFTISSFFDLVDASATLFPIKSHVLLTTFLEAVFRPSNLVSQNCFFYFLTHDKNTYPLTYFLFPGSIEYRHIAKLEESVISSY